MTFVCNECTIFITCTVVELHTDIILNYHILSIDKMPIIVGGDQWVETVHVVMEMRVGCCYGSITHIVYIVWVMVVSVVGVSL